MFTARDHEKSRKITKQHEHGKWQFNQEVPAKLGELAPAISNDTMEKRPCPPWEVGSLECAKVGEGVNLVTFPLFKG